MDHNKFFNKNKILKITCITARSWRDEDYYERITMRTDLSTFIVEVYDNKIEEFPNSDEIYKILNLNCKGDYDDKLYTKYQHKTRDGEVIEKDLIDVLLKQSLLFDSEYHIGDNQILNVLSAQYVN